MTPTINNTMRYIANIALPAAEWFLPGAWASRESRAFILTVGLQESQFEHRAQMNNGPARSYFQFEKGTVKSRGGVTGIMLHTATKDHLAHVCGVMDYKFDATVIWDAITDNDVLACVCARLLLYTVPSRLPRQGEYDLSWKQYAQQSWRPGKPHRATWNAYYDLAWSMV